MKSYLKSLEHGSVSKPSKSRTDFEFPIGISNEPSNNVVFCGKVITRKTELDPVPQSKRNTAVVAGIKSSSGRENRYKRSGSERKSFSGMFGNAKFPLQMELSDIKMRQERKVPLPFPKFKAEEDVGGESCWELVQPLRRQGSIMSLLKASFGCIRIV